MIRWPFQAHYLFILTHFIRAWPDITIQNEKTIYAMPGRDVTLRCCILKQDGIHVTQTQWSKVDAAPPSKIAVYNPVYGVKYLHFTEMGYNHSVNFSQQCHHHQSDLDGTCGHNPSTANYTGCNQWSLQLNNVSLEQTGQYECSFATYPVGIRSSEINLIVNKPDEKSSVVEILLNQTLEIPCFKGKNSSILASAPLKWLMKGMGNEEILITKQLFYPLGYRTNDTISKERIHVGPENTLRISPVSILDDGKIFVCCLTPHPEMKSTTEVKVFVKPEIAPILHTSIAGKVTLTCVVRKAFPKPDLLWSMDRKILKDNSEGMFLENEDIKDEEGFHEMRSLLTIWDTFQPPVPHIFRCTAVYRFPGNELRNVSKEIHFPLRFQTTSLPAPEIISQVTAVSDSSREAEGDFKSHGHLQENVPAPPSVQQSNCPYGSITLFEKDDDDDDDDGHLHATTNLQDITVIKASSHSTVPQRMQDSATVTSKAPVYTTHHQILTPSGRQLSTKRVTDLTSETISSSSPTVKGGFHLTDHPSTQRVTEVTSQTSHKSSSTIKSGFDISDNLSVIRATEVTSLISPGNSPTVKVELNITGVTMNPEPHPFSWPAFVAALLFVCSLLMILGIRKWCHYQKEIMNRPPSFKPPPPPIQYTSMQESEGIYPPCPELENL